MTQVSRPMIIALAGTLLFAAVWFTLLRPKPADDVVTAPATPAATPATPSADGSSVTDAPAQAQAAVDATNAASAQAEAQADAATGDTAAPAAPATDDTAAGSSSSSATQAAGAETPAREVTTDAGVPAGEAAVLRQLADGKVVVMLFWNASSADDRAARRAVTEATKGDKDVAVRVVRAENVGSYEAITGGVTVAQTPTTMIIGPERKAVTITGLIDPLEIEQAIARMAPAKG
ncbi:MAG: hypothetical protein JHC84_03465 [Solirubrobacteraceae bacterium]|nr:hypothetical protein [Solirubrobacteraceae bacterium]